MSRIWHKLWGGLLLLVGDPEHVDSWCSIYYRDLAEPRPPPFDIGCLVQTDGGFSILLCRWLLIINPWTNQSHYQPLIWFEYVPSGQHLAIRFTVPLERGRFDCIIPLSISALKSLGLIHFKWNSWKERQEIDDGCSKVSTT